MVDFGDEVDWIGVVFIYFLAVFWLEIFLRV